MRIFDKGPGRRRAMTLPEALQEIQRLRQHITDQNAETERIIHDLTHAILRTTNAEGERDHYKALASTMAGKVVRAEAEQRRLRKAVIDARPRITPIVHHARVAPWAPGVLHVSDIDTGLHVTFADYQVTPPPIDPFRDLGGYRADGTDPETTLSIRIADLAGDLAGVR